MILINPRITDHHGIDLAQADVDFAIPFLNEDIPLYVDPFLLWKSPSQQDQALHTTLVNSFNHLNYLLRKSKEDKAREILIEISECDEVGLGHSARRRGHRIGESKANEILGVFKQVEHYSKFGFTHFEEIQLYVSDIAKDRISDFSCSFMKSFLIDYTIQESKELGIPLEEVRLRALYDYRSNDLKRDESVHLPVNPESGDPIIFVPKRWLRFTPWIAFDDYFRNYCPRDEALNPDHPIDPVKVLTFNRQNYGVVENYIRAKERTQADCVNDPLFRQIPVTSAKRKLSTILKIRTGNKNLADKKYENATVQLLASLLYPHLDLACDQVRTDSGSQIRDLIFFNNQSLPFLREIYELYGTRQLVFEIKNVEEIQRQHINQLNRYLDSGLGKFGVFVTRNTLSRAMQKNIVDLWSGQRRSIIVLTDEDLKLMVNVFESKQRDPIDVLKRSYVEFRRKCPS